LYSERDIGLSVVCNGTSTPTLQALGNNDPAVGYSVAYPIGVAGHILFLYVGFLILKPKIETSTGTGLEMLEILVRDAELTGKTLAEVMTTLPTLMIVMPGKIIA